jgi:hypothetical protein
VGNRFGFALALQGDTLVVGANGARAIYVFRNTGGTWAETQKITVGGDPAGVGSALSLDGNTLAFGVLGETEAGFSLAGAAYVYTRSSAGTNFTQQQRIASPAAAASRVFGFALSVSGDTLIVGEPSLPSPTAPNGSAYVFVRTGSSWAQQGSALSGLNLESNAQFGSAIRLRGNTAVIGAYLDNTAAGNDAGSVWRFDRTGSNWSAPLELVPTPAPAANLRFGRSLSLGADRLAIGASFDGLTSGVGRAFTFTGFGGDLVFKNGFEP